MNPKLLFVSWSPSGGAGIAAYRLYRALKAAGWSVRFLVLEGDQPGTHEWEAPEWLPSSSGFAARWGKLSLALRVASRRLFWKFQAVWQDWFMKGQTEPFEILTLRQGIERVDHHPWFQWADVVHLHWTAGFLAPRQAWSKKTWVVSLHDCHPFTGVCHFPGTCRGFESGCRTCPQLRGTKNPGLAALRFRQKRSGYGELPNVWLHAPSHWVAGEAQKSLLLGRVPTKVIANLVPTESFRPLDRVASRQLLGLPHDKKLALFVAGQVRNTRKGFQWFQKLAAEYNDGSWFFVVVGAGEVSASTPNCIALGSLADPRLMASAYSAADVFITTATQDNLPSTLIESQLCGTPVIGFSAGGPAEMVAQGKTGWLEAEISVETLVRGLDWYTRETPSRESIAEWARAQWSEEIVLPQWMEFYRSLV